MHGIETILASALIRGGVYRIIWALTRHLGALWAAVASVVAIVIGAGLNRYVRRRR